MDFTTETQKNVDLLKRKLGDTIRCPMCTHTNFGVVDGRVLHPIQLQPNAFQIGGPAIASIMLVCQHCGYILQFSVDVLSQDNS